MFKLREVDLVQESTKLLSLRFTAQTSGLIYMCSRTSNTT